MDDLGAEGLREMVCGENANDLENKITILTGATQTITVTYSVESLF
jgi:hypothetical protein